MKYYGYPRKSSESDERQIQSIDDQLNILKPLAKQREYDIVEWLKESGSAKKPGRIVFNQMVEGIEKGTANGIIVWDPSRLSRNSVDTGRLIYLMDQGKLLEVVTPSQVFRNTPNDKFLLSLLCSVAKKENDDKSENVKRALQQRAERGLPIGPPRPGYRSIPGRRQGERGHEPDPIYFSLMKTLIKSYLTSRFSVMDLVRRAEFLGITNYKGKKITKTCMFRLLQDPYYCGIIKNKENSYQAQHLPMFTQAEFDLIQDILSGKKRIHLIKRRFPLAGGLIKCGECGYSVIGETHCKKYASGKVQEFTYYRCSKKGQTKCSQPYLQADKLENQAIEFLNRLEVPADFVNLAIQCINDQNSQLQEEREAQRKALKTKYDNANRKLENLLDLFISPGNADKSVLTNEELAELKVRCTKERNDALAELERFDKVADESMDLTAKAFNFAAGLIKRFKRSLEDKRKVMLAVGSNLILLDQKLYVEARVPFKLARELFETLFPKLERVEPKDRALLRAKLLNSSYWYRVRESNP